MSKVVKAAKDGQAAKGAFAKLLSQIAQGPAAEWEKEDLERVMYWQKQITALLLGIIWGIIPFMGVLGIAAFVSAQVVTTIMFYRLVLRVDEERYGGAGDYLFDAALLPLVGSFFLVWTLAYNMVHVPPAYFSA